MGGRIPGDPLGFVQECVRAHRILWTYHVSMRLARRFISRKQILDAVDRFQIIEAYPEDKYLPSYLVMVAEGVGAFHVLFAADVAGDNVRVVTAYRPDPREWEADLRSRRTSR